MFFNAKKPKLLSFWTSDFLTYENKRAYYYQISNNPKILDDFGISFKNILNFVSVFSIIVALYMP